MCDLATALKHFTCATLNKMMKRIPLLLLLASLTFGQGLINRRAPSFSLPDSNFKQFDILDYRGKWLLVTFMMMTDANCPSCKTVMKKLDALQTKHGNKLAVLAITQTPQDNQDSVKKFIADTKTKTPVVFDYSFVGMAYFKATPAKPAMDIPHIFAVDPNGTIVQDFVERSITADSFGAEIDKLVSRGSGGGAVPAGTVGKRK
jgi:peroxiredoxin